MPVIYDSSPVIKPTENFILSKYIDLSKFLSLLSTNSLFFCRLDKLEDPFEGTIAKKNFDEIIRKGKEKNPLLTDEEILAPVNKYTKLFDAGKEIFCINCWNKTQNESAALWKIYSEQGKGILIKSSIQNIKDAFVDTKEGILISEVKYLDYNNELMPGSNLIYPVIHKQHAYAYEDEVRLIHQVALPQVGKKYDWGSEYIEEGKLLKVNLDVLLDEIIMGPFSPNWMVDIIKNILMKYGLNKEVKKSHLAL